LIAICPLVKPVKAGDEDTTGRLVPDIQKPLKGLNKGAGKLLSGRSVFGKTRGRGSYPQYRAHWNEVIPRGDDAALLYRNPARRAFWDQVI
jgi:hypothetical protein